MNLYLYCLSGEVADGVVESVVGVGSAIPRLVQVGEIAAIVSEFDEGQARVTRENVMAHERVVRRVLAETTPLPFRFGTVVTEERLQDYLSSQADSLKAQLLVVRGCVEMGVKVIWNLEAVKRESAELNDAKESTQVGMGEAGQGSGTAFLLAKRREILGRASLQARAYEVAGQLSEALAATIREARVTIQPEDALVISAAHLVERARLKEYKAALTRLRREHTELHFLTSGAWPPYSFARVSS